ncbi:MAG: hypothetical protein JRH20_19120 [Deltaproteobacteria bacterium]|nr:hypothetical protein [Deltaproteobacteria bacterium]
MTTFRTIHTHDVINAGSSAQSKGGLKHALTVLTTAALVCSLPYLIPSLHPYQPWTLADPLPFIGFFQATSTGPQVAEASGGVSSHAALSHAERTLLNFVPEKAQAPKSTPPHDLGATPIVIPPAEIADVKVKIEDPSHAMRAFYRALSRTGQSEKGAITRISHWGDSAIAPDKITAVARILLQKRFGDAGHGFILAAPATRWYHYAGINHKYGNWKLRRITHGGAKDGRYGYGGVRAIGSSKSFTRLAISPGRTIGNRVSRYEIYYLKGPHQGSLSFRVDGKRKPGISAKAPSWRDAVHTIRVPDGNHRLSLQVSGSVSVYGVVLERDVPGVVYDNLGLIGHSAKRLLKAQETHFRSQLAFRKPDLMVLSMGGNTLVRKYWKPERYRAVFTQSVKRFRDARKSASCLVLPPLDHGERVGGTVRTVPRLLEMKTIQREVALKQGCAFYDIFAAMGGKGTMGRWATTRPRLVLHDYAHVTRHGARILGALIYKALLHGFATHLASTNQPP